MKIHIFCRHKTVGWEGIVYEDDYGKTYITNGIGVWETNEKRLSSLDTVTTIDIPLLCGNMEKYCPNTALMELLQTALHEL